MAKPQLAESAPHVLVFPFPAQGHMLPLLDLTHLLSLRHLHLTVVVTPKNLPLLFPLLSSSPSVQPLVLPFPTYPLLPPDAENTKDLPDSAASYLHIMHALSHLHAPIIAWANSISNPPVALISDFFLGWTFNLAQDLGIPRIVFSPSGALAIAAQHYLWDVMPKPCDPAGAADFLVRFETLPNSPVFKWNQVSKMYRCFVEGDLGPLSEFVREGFLANVRSWGLVINTFEDLEAAYLDHIKEADLGHSRVWADGRGLVIRGWAPQVEVLGHGSVGSFLTHCGWNSVLEGIAAGVAMLTWPMWADQFYNAMLLEEETRTGVRICEGRDSVPDPDELGRIMAASVSRNNENRVRAEKLSKMALAAVKDGGSSWRDVEALVDKINGL